MTPKRLAIITILASLLGAGAVAQVTTSLATKGATRFGQVKFPNEVPVQNLSTPDAHGVMYIESVDGAPAQYGALPSGYDAGPGIAIHDATLQMAMTITPSIVCLDSGNPDAQAQQHCTPQVAHTINGGTFRCWTDAANALPPNACYASAWPVYAGLDGVKVNNDAMTIDYSLTDDCYTTGVDGGATNLICTQATGGGAGYNVKATIVKNVNVTTNELGPITTTATSSTMTWALPLATGGWLDVLVEGRVPGDAGSNTGLAGGAKWTCGVTSYGTNSCAAFSACTASSAWASNADAGSAATVSVAVAAGGAGCTATITVNSGVLNMDWTAVAQYASVQ
jgi:hypothetical protein